MTYTLEQVQDQATVLGIDPSKAEAFFHHFNAQGWNRANGQKITDLYSMLWNWKNNPRQFAKKEGFEQKMTRLAKERKSNDRSTG